MSVMKGELRMSELRIRSLPLCLPVSLDLFLVLIGPGFLICRMGIMMSKQHLLWRVRRCGGPGKLRGCLVGTW